MKDRETHSGKSSEEDLKSQLDDMANNFEPKDFAKALYHYLSSQGVKRESSKLLDEVVDIMSGNSDMEFGRDKRFKDSAWTDNGIYKRVGLSYLAFCNALDALVEEDKEDPMRYEKAKLAINHITAALSPTNSLLGNPAALRKAFSSKGRSLISGASNFIQDFRKNGGLPRQVDDSGFTVGVNLAATSGSVIYRNELLEILQYKPTTTQVYEIPTLVMTPQLNKYYFLDLAPGRSFVEYMTSQGHQIFIVSWRNPGPDQAGWGLSDYCEALHYAIDAVREVTKSDSINTFGICAGGLTMTSLASYLANTGQDYKINSLSYAVTLLDFGYPAMIGILKSEFLLKSARENSSKKGVLDGKKLGALFTLLRPQDLIWNYWENNYLLGNEPPPFDILAWNNDTTNMTAELHHDFLRIFDGNLMTKTGELEIMGTPLDVSQIKQDAFVVGTVNDHLTPWIGCYQTTQLLGGKTEFVLSSAGHIAGLVNPPNNPKSFYMTGPSPGPSHESWLDKAEKHTGSWWEQWLVWAATHSGNKKRARKTLGSKKHPPLADAPGHYVLKAK